MILTNSLFANLLQYQDFYLKYIWNRESKLALYNDKHKMVANQTLWRFSK